MKINLNQLAAAIAKLDNPADYNACVVAAKTVLANLGKTLRDVDSVTAAAIWAAITERAGKRGA